MVILAVFPSLRAAELVLSINLSIIFTFYNDNSVPLCCS